MKSMGSRTLTRPRETSCRQARNTTPASRRPLLAQGCASAQGSIQLSSPVRRNSINIGYNATAGDHYCHAGHNVFRKLRVAVIFFLRFCMRVVGAKTEESIYDCSGGRNGRECAQLRSPAFPALVGGLGPWRRVTSFRPQCMRAGVLHGPRPPEVLRYERQDGTG